MYISLMITWNLISTPKLASVILIRLILIVIFRVNNVLFNQRSTILEWHLWSVNSADLNVQIIIDKIRIVFTLTVLTISFRVILFSISYISNDINLEYFITIVLRFILSINCLILFPHIVILLLGWDGLGLTSYLLVIYYINDKSLSAGILTALVNRIGDALIILGASVSLIRGHWNFTFRRYNRIWVVGAILLVAAITKRAQIPFSAWLPAAIAAPTPVSALVHSSTLVTAGIYLLIRFFPTLRIFWIFPVLCFYIGVITCIIARLSATFETDLKKIIALSTLSQLGIMIISLGLNQPSITFFHLITHALFKALLFICAGTIIHNSYNNQDIRIIGNLYKRIPTTCTVFNIANLSLCGFPFIAGFYSKDMVVETFLTTSIPISTRLLMIIRVALTAVYTVRLSIISLWNNFKGPSITYRSDTRKFTHISYFILIFGAIIRGVAFQWRIDPSIVVLTIPGRLKLLTLNIILGLRLSTFILIGIDRSIKGYNYLCSIIFLREITRSPANRISYRVAIILNYNEITWIEKLRGQGTLTIMKPTSINLNKINNIKLSQLLTIIAFIVILTVIIL